MVEPLRHRQTKEAATDMFSLKPPRHIPTLPIASVSPDHGDFRSTPVNGHSQDRRACLKDASIGHCCYQADCHRLVPHPPLTARRHHYLSRAMGAKSNSPSPCKTMKLADVSPLL